MIIYLDYLDYLDMIIYQCKRLFVLESKIIVFFVVLPFRVSVIVTYFLPSLNIVCVEQEKLVENCFVVLERKDVWGILKVIFI